MLTMQFSIGWLESVAQLKIGTELDDYKMKVTTSA